MPILIEHSENQDEKRHTIGEDSVTIGREPRNSIELSELFVSREHARIIQRNGKYLLEDLNSKHGTFLNRRMIHQPTRLLNGDKIRICETNFTFFVEDSISKIGIREKKTSEEQNRQARKIESSILLDDGDDAQELSSIMSKMDLSSHFKQEVASPEAKLNALMEITKALGTAIALDKVLPSVLDCLFDLFKQVDRGFIVMADEKGDLKPLAMKLRRSEEEGTIRISRTIVRHVLEHKQAVISRDASADDRFDLAQSITDFRIRSLMCAPLIDTDGKSVGVIQLDSLSNGVSFQNEDLDILATVAIQASAAIDKAKMYEREKQADEWERDAELAKEVQKSLLPEAAPDFSGYELFDYYLPASHVGGDYFDYISLDDHRLAMLVGDVVGHGIAAALLMAKVSAESRFALAKSQPASTSMNQLNQAISNLNLDKFVTMVLALLDRENDRLTIVNAGHPPPIVRKKDGETYSLSTEKSGLPVGIIGGFEYEEFSISLEPGDMVVLYTDGVNEAQNPQAEQFGHERIIHQLAEKPWSSCGEFGKSLITSVNQHLEGGKQDDDVCLVCLRRTE
ncbi:MAG: SpoIIE family protein phosphatase [Pirellulaceae bacterium]|nr:SpoIIE family protein phosphatase [Pirellulaceae bacterium]